MNYQVMEHIIRSSFKLHAYPPLQKHYVTRSSYFVPCKLLLQSQKSVCRYIYELFTFWAYLLDMYSWRGILDKKDSAVCEKGDNAGVSLAARKNKTHCMTNTRHTFPINGGVQIQWNIPQIISLPGSLGLLYPQKIIVRHSISAFQVVTPGPG